MSDKMEKINDHLETLVLSVVTLEEGDIPGMGQVLNTICSLETDCEGMDESVFLSVTQAVKGCLERLILGEPEDTTPLEEGRLFQYRQEKLYGGEKDILEEQCLC